VDHVEDYPHKGDKANLGIIGEAEVASPGTSPAADKLPQMDDDTLALGKTIGAELELGATVSAPAGAQPPAPGAPAPVASQGPRFALEREIGRGGMGRIIEATDRQFRRKVAIKEMLPIGGAQAKKRFLTEALVTGNLEHPGIPAVYERGDGADGSAYYAMQLVSGRTLAAALDDAKTLEERLRLLPTIVKVAETVAYAHDKGVVHRDLKPENVLVGRHGQAFLLDWGIAKVRGMTTADTVAEPAVGGAASDAGKTQAGTLMGSPMYMAPEQARGDVAAIDERTDVFALGAMLYHTLTGRAPYDGKTVMELVTRAAEARPPAVTDLVADVNPELAAICTKAMQRDPAERHKSALELAAALEAFQSHAAQTVPSRWDSGVMNAGLGAVILMATLLLGLGLFGVYMLVTLGAGPMGYICLFETAVSLALAAVEYRTRGHRRLVGVGLAIVPITLGVALSQLLMGSAHTLGAMGAPELAHDPGALIQLGAQGLGEAMYGPIGTVPLALAQIVVWALVARRNTVVGAAERGTSA